MNQCPGHTNNVGHVAVEGLGDAGGVDACDGVMGIAVDVLRTRLVSAAAAGNAFKLPGLLWGVAVGLMSMMSTAAAGQHDSSSVEALVLVKGTGLLPSTTEA